MPSTFRIPKAEISGVYGRAMAAYAKRTWGQIPDVAYVVMHHPRLARTIFGFESKVGKWRELDPDLKSIAELASAAQIGCSWCVDFGYYLAHNDGLDLAKLRLVPQWRDHADQFTELERDVLTYTEAMTATPPTVTDDMVQRLLDQLGTKATVELTQMIGLENMRSRVNYAAGLQSQGFSDVCELPITVPQHG